jgi:antitoxin component HigA of HigAB toxin-antitoxin module
MNWPQMHSDWKELKEVLKTYWSDLSEEDLVAIDGNRDQLARLLQHRRALGPEQIEKEIVAFEIEARFPGEVK